MTERIPHIYTRYHDRRPFEDYLDQPDTAERIRLQVQSIEFALPAKKREEANAPNPVR